MPRTFSIRGSFHAAAANTSREQCGPSNNQLSCQPRRQYTQRRIVLISLVLGIHFDSRPGARPPPFYQHANQCLAGGLCCLLVWPRSFFCGMDDIVIVFLKKELQAVGDLKGSRAVVTRDFFLNFRRRHGRLSRL